MNARSPHDQTVSEAEASNKWCPYAKDGSTNRNPAGGALMATFCIGSACMAWRWAPTYSRDNPTRTAVGAVDVFEYAKGYCGAFGKP